MTVWIFDGTVPPKDPSPALFQQSVGFLDQVFCTRYSRPGDSGSLVLDQATGKAVGLHFAGANGGSVFSPIATVLSTLGVKLVTKSVGSPQSAGRPHARRRRAAKRRH